LNNFSKLASNKNIKLYTKKDYFSIIEKRSNIGFGLAKESIFLQEMRRFGGFINGTKFNLINVADVSKETVFDDTRKIRYIGIFSGKLTIIDDSLGIAIPGIVWADDERGSRYRIELITPYGINQAKTGEKFYVHGDLYKNIHTQERIIILSFWGHGEIRFNLLLKNDYEKTRQ